MLWTRRRGAVTGITMRRLWNPLCNVLAPLCYKWIRMDTDQTIGEVESLERMFALPDTRPLTERDLSAANSRHDHLNANSPWFKMWRDFGACSRSAQ